MPRSWIETRVEVPLDLAEIVAAQLVELGSPGLVTEDRGGRTELIAYFDGESDVAALRTWLTSQKIDAAIRTQSIGEENWAENWKEHFQPVAIGAKLFLCPPWATAAPAGRIAIVIDPGMAFGTGHHTTTRACLELLESRVRKGDAVLDVGTGSGVLSIAALLLGAARAVGVDTDPLATTAAAENAERNGVGAALSLHNSLDDTAALFDVCVANIQLNVLSELAPAIAARVRPGGILIASGLLREERETWRARYEPEWEIGESSGDAQWMAIAATRRS